MFDEQPDADMHGECAAEIANLRHLLGQCYAKLMKFGVENSDPFLMDELKMTLMRYYDEPEYQNDVQAAFGGIVQTPQG